MIHNTPSCTATPEIPVRSSGDVKITGEARLNMPVERVSG
jgi:hypothetical protein